MKKNKNMELQIYELLGVKKFKKMAFALRDFLMLPLTFGMNKNKRRDFLYHTSSNYNIGNIRSFENIRKFKVALYVNSSIHLTLLLINFPIFVELFNGNLSLLISILSIASAGINLYCLMLQRYNCIRINQVIHKMSSKYEKKKEKIKEELTKQNSKQKNLSYTIIDKKQNESNISFEDFICKASLKELMHYREYLTLLQGFDKMHDTDTPYFDKNPIYFDIPMEKKKTLRLALLPSDFNKSATK